MRHSRFRSVVPGRHSALLVAVFLAAGCTVAGSAVIAPYRSRPLSSLAAHPVLSGSAGVLALAPNGAVVAVADPVHGVCLRSVYRDTAEVCAGLTLTAKASITAAFSPDGQTVAMGRDVSAQGHGTVYLVDVRTGSVHLVPNIDSPLPASSPAPPSRSPAVAVTSGSYIEMLWNRVDGHLLLISTSTRPDGDRTGLVDLDPESLIPRLVAEATSPYEFQSGYVATGGPTVIFTVYRGDQIPPNLVVIDLESGVRKEFGPLGPNGSRLTPLAVSPDGRQAIVGSATYGDPGPPRLLDLRTGALTDIPGLTGNFVAACYSPNGAQIAVVSSIGAAVERIAVAPVSGGRAMTLSDVPPRLVDGTTLSWSGVDVVSIETPQATGSGSVVGWALSS